MPRYEIQTEEVFRNRCAVEAKSREDALKKLHKNYTEFVRNNGSFESFSVVNIEEVEDP